VPESIECLLVEGPNREALSIWVWLL
jgi:hypothetical protein